MVAGSSPAGVVQIFFYQRIAFCDRIVGSVGNVEVCQNFLHISLDPFESKRDLGGNVGNVGSI
jgi:hypothetical protein